MMLSAAKDVFDGRSVLWSQVGDDHFGSVTLGFQRQQEGSCAMCSVARIDSDVQQVIGIQLGIVTQVSSRSKSTHFYCRPRDTTLQVPGLLGLYGIVLSG